MSQVQATNINAYRSEAIDALARANNAQQEAEAAVDAFVAMGGDESEVRPTKKVNRNSKSGEFASDKETEANPDGTTTETVPGNEVLPESFKTADHEYVINRTSKGKVYQYQKDGVQIKKAEYAQAYHDSLEAPEA